MRLVLDIDTNNPLDTKGIFEVLEKAYPDRLISLHMIDESNHNQFYSDEQPIIDAIIKTHRETVLDDDGYIDFENTGKCTPTPAQAEANFWKGM